MVDKCVGDHFNRVVDDAVNVSVKYMGKRGCEIG